MRLGITKIKSVFSVSSEEFLTWICSLPANHWILENPEFFALLEEICGRLKPEQCKRLMAKELVFARSNGFVSCAFTLSRPANVVVLFPEIFETAWLESGSSPAVIAHELGHIFHNHAARDISPLEAQVEADAFAMQLGYRKELCLLLENEAGQEASRRLSKLRKAA